MAELSQTQLEWLRGLPPRDKLSEFTRPIVQAGLAIYRESTGTFERTPEGDAFLKELTQEDQNG